MYKIPHGVIAKVLDSSLEVSKFELYSGRYIHFQINTLWEWYKIPLSLQLNRITAVLLHVLTL